MPADVIEEVARLRREQIAFIEDAEGILQSVERKRAQAAGRKGRETRDAPTPAPWDEMEESAGREAILARGRQLGIVREGD